MKIKVSDLKTEPKLFEFSSEVKSLEDDLNSNSLYIRKIRSINSTLNVYKALEDIIIDGSSVVTVNCECSRCLDIIDSELFISIKKVLKKSVSPNRDEEDYGLSFYSSNEISLEDYIHDEIILGIPDVILCNESCLGICLNCKINLNFSHCICKSSAVN